MGYSDIKNARVLVDAASQKAKADEVAPDRHNNSEIP